MNLEDVEKVEILRSFEKSRRLYQLTHSEGWADLLDILEAEVIKAEFRLMNLPAGSSAELLRDLHAHARAARTIFEQVQLRVNAEIESGRELANEPPSYQTTNL